MVTKRTLIVVLAIWQYIYLIAQPDTLILGYGGYSGVSISASSNVGPGSSENTMNQDGFIPNENAASRFLSQATLGYDYSDIISVTEAGIEAWIENQLTIPRSFTLESKIRQYHKMVKDSTNTPTAGAGNRLWDYAWWQYLMTSQDDLRQRVALALSEMLVISENSAFNNNAYAMGVYYDKLLNHSFGNYRNLLRDVTYNPSMGIYLTYH